MTRHFTPDATTGLVASDTPPAWMDRSDLTADISAEWQDATGREEAALAHFSVSEEEGDPDDPQADAVKADYRNLLGAVIETEDGPRYVSRFFLSREGIDCLALDGWVDQ